MNKLDELIITIGTFMDRNKKAPNVVVVSEDVKKELTRCANKPWLPKVTDYNTICNIPLAIIDGVDIMRVGWTE